MKKYIVIISLFAFLLFPQDLIYAKQKTFIERTISVAIPAIFSIWGFRQKSNYGITTGCIFSLRAIYELFKE